MSEIHHAIIQCMTSTLSELKRSNTTLDLDDLNVENAYFKSFNVIVRKQLDPVWHKVGPKTKQLVNDLGTLRNLLYYLLTYDSLQFHAYLETLIAANTTTSSGGVKQHQSPWMLTDAAHIIFETARRRCYTVSSTSVKPAAPVIDLVDDEDAWDALNEAEGIQVDKKGKGKERKDRRPGWLPTGLDPILEELPKWDLLTQVLDEIEEEIVKLEMMKKSGPRLGSDTVLVMASSTRTCNLITDFLSSHNPTGTKGAKGRDMMMQKLRVYLWWKGKLSQRKEEGRSSFHLPDVGSTAASMKDPKGTSLSEALRKKDKEKAERNQSRRRVRGGAPAAAAPDGRSTTKSSTAGQSSSAPAKPEADVLAEFWSQVTPDASITPFDVSSIALLDLPDLDDNYGLVVPSQTVVVRAFSDDSDDRILAELQPRFIVMYEPNMEFIRRIEVYRSASPGMGVRVYHMVYGSSCEEHKYLAGIRKEKESFERLIKERATMLLPIYEERREGAGRNEEVIKTISSRYAGGRRELNTEPSKVIVDMREFRSTLPSLLHAANILVIPATLTVGDYILTPEICVERKSLPDLVASFNSGRLYTQCELMSVHYKHPVLLIEFEEDKAFSLELITEMKSYVKPTGKYPAKKKPDAGTPNNATAYSSVSVQSKLVLLTLHFPQLRIIWSSSPFSSSEIFTDLKRNQAEPDPTKAIAVGADDDPDAGRGVNSAAEELVRCLPGVTAKNVKYLMSRVGSVRELCGLSLQEVQQILGVEPGKECWEFMHKGEKQ
ncbi:hypothetical protein EST38_g6377 [Candolleomyces aberdarensis]|uniref:ERCC4 domain-containing protein n=1 Tax=Candolleomyces aberdarensis TaxID=2316362 RepID=A0A4Q2DJV5_9AGAR|nr:hypothetical protein EST38_g6377 [Candolleomyces aberdarensis]